MFTGLIAALGTVASAERSAGKLRLGILGPFADLQVGESVAVDGCCLTVTLAKVGEFFVDIAEESLRRTTLGSLRSGARVHLERALRLGERLGGHIVQGHIDGTATLVERRQDGDALWLSFVLPESAQRLMAEKGSIALAGVSLTVAALAPPRVSVMIIPHTQTETLLGGLTVGDRVNYELDMIAKHLAALAAPYIESAP